MSTTTKWLAWFVALIAMIHIHASFTWAQEEIKPGTTGIVIGTLSEITDQYLRVQPAGDVPNRYWFKWISMPGAQPDPKIAAAVTKLHIDDQVEVHWSFDDRKRIESVRFIKSAPVAATQEAASGIVKPEAAPTNLPSPTPPLSSGNTTGDTVNALIDNLLATGNRLLELPLLMLLAILVAGASVLALILERILRRGRRFQMARVVLVAMGVMVIATATLIVDRKIAQLQNEVSELRTKSSANALALLNTVSTQKAVQGPRQSFMFDPAEVRKNLAPIFGDVSLRPLSYDEATDVVQVQMQKPLAQAYMAVIDLRNPAIEIKLAADFNTKTLTSAFARAADCTVAINGEAGNSPGPASGLGPWRGFMMRQGQILLQEDPKIQRPFLSFDRQNRATFRPQTVPDRATPPDAFNIMWGRLDAIIKGQVQTADENFRQPRTAMGINQDGTRLYLMVVDGRQPNYSMGFTRAEVGHFLKAFGASDGMLCDEGGSSCIYLKQFGGISNIPSDNQGRERATYTHFGIALRQSP